AVSVLPRLTVTCAFHYVQNARYGTRTRHRGDEAEFVAMLNEIWRPQANIEFVQVPGNAGDKLDLKMTENLRDVIDTRAKFDAVARRRDPRAQFNVFFVREVEMAPAAGGNFSDSAEAVTTLGPPGDCLFEDAVDLPGVTIGHEAGHCLTLD